MTNSVYKINEIVCEKHLKSFLELNFDEGLRPMTNLVLKTNAVFTVENSTKNSGKKF